MPEKDPATWATLIFALPETTKAAIVGAAVAFIRILYDDREPSNVRRLLECCLCGAISMCVASLAEAIGGGDYSTFIGGSVGLLGADHVRTLARKFAQKKIDTLEQKS